MLRVPFDGAYTIFPFLESRKPFLDDFLIFILAVLWRRIVSSTKSGMNEDDRLFGGYGFFFRFSHFHISETEASRYCVEELFTSWSRRLRFLWLGNGERNENEVIISVIYSIYTLKYKITNSTPFLRHFSQIISATTHRLEIAQVEEQNQGQTK
jgi:hypothetical protein